MEHDSARPAQVEGFPTHVRRPPPTRGFTTRWKSIQDALQHQIAGTPARCIVKGSECDGVTVCVQGGWTALMIASDMGHVEVVKHLVKHGGKELMMAQTKVRGL